LLLGPGERLSTFVPDYWKASVSALEQSGSALVKTVQLPPGVFNPDRDMTMPSPRAASFPKYTDAARRAKLQGTAIFGFVLNPDGTITNLTIVWPVGLGLDDNGAASIANWRSRPVTKNGSPVAVWMKVELRFRPQQ
jgi:TonB family protein